MAAKAPAGHSSASFPVPGIAAPLSERFRRQNIDVAYPGFLQQQQKLRRYTV